MVSIVKYTGASDAQVNWGNGKDPREYLNIGKLYELERKEVHSWHTLLELKEFPNKLFNSVCFEELP